MMTEFPVLSELSLILFLDPLFNVNLYFMNAEATLFELKILLNFLQQQKKGNLHL